MYENIIIGLTGSFGSGCNEAYKYLKDKGFEQFSLAAKIRKIAEEKGIDPNRNNLQNIGDGLRKDHGQTYLVEDVFSKISWKSKDPIVIKSIRNDKEALFFKKRLINFFLINIDAPRKLRLQREKKKKKSEFTTDEDFDKVDERDTGEEEPPYGQHVKKCVDYSDIIINNDGSKNDLHKKIEYYLNLIEKPGIYRPTELETHMAEAYFWSMQSSCLKRKVGAIIVKNGYTISSGYNDTPKRRIIEKENKYIELKIPSCKEICYRDMYKRCFNEECNKLITFILDRCHECNMTLDKNQKNVLSKHLDLCRAIHAEERAILQTAKFGGQSLENTTLYTTTYPCQLCAKKIIEVGISKVVYIDPYPYKESHKILKHANIELEKFEGVKSRKFDNLYMII